MRTQEFKAKTRSPRAVGDSPYTERILTDPALQEAIREALPKPKPRRSQSIEAERRRRAKRKAKLQQKAFDKAKSFYSSSPTRVEVTGSFKALLLKHKQ